MNKIEKVHFVILCIATLLSIPGALSFYGALFQGVGWIEHLFPKDARILLFPAATLVWGIYFGISWTKAQIEEEKEEIEEEEKIEE